MTDKQIYKKLYKILAELRDVSLDDTFQAKYDGKQMAGKMNDAIVSVEAMLSEMQDESICQK